MFWRSEKRNNVLQNFFIANFPVNSPDFSSVKFHLVSLLHMIRKSLEARVLLNQVLLNAGDKPSVYR